MGQFRWADGYMDIEVMGGDETDITYAPELVGEDTRLIAEREF